MSKQTVKTTDDQTNGSLVVDDEAKSPPRLNI